MEVIFGTVDAVLLLSLLRVQLQGDCWKGTITDMLWPLHSLSPPVLPALQSASVHVGVDLSASRAQCTLS